MHLHKLFRLCLVTGVVLTVITACSSQKNTAGRRFWQSFTAKYNTYYNGTLAYIDGSLEKEQSNKDNFTELIPLYYVGNKASQTLGEGNFDRAIEKSEKVIKLHSIKKRPVWTKKRRKTDRDIEWLNRREYNPMMWKAWLLLGRSQFHKGDFDGAAATFSYMSRLYQTQPAIYGKARAWLAKAYVEADWLYDAEDVMRNMSRDSMHWSAKKEWDYTYADYYIHTGEYERAIPYLKEVIKHEGRRKQKARECFLLGQLYTLTGNNAEAYKAYRRVFRQHPPYELQFNARIAMTEVMAQGQAKRMVSKLKRMARNDNNKDYLDQVYYAMGNIYMSQKDTLAAIGAYEKGNEKSTRNGIEKGVLLLRLGDIYWDMERYADAGRCYGEAIGLLDRDRKDYAQLADRSRKLDLLVPFTESIHLEDSLQELAQMSESDRNAAIDRVIEALKKKEKEERDAEAIAAAAETVAKNSMNTGRQSPTVTDNSTVNGIWYFYNTQAVTQGKQAFQRQWGKRDNVDHWQRANQTVVDFGFDEEEEELSEAQLDSIRIAEEEAEALEAKMDSAVNDPHKREYYLAQIPFTEEQKEASDLIIMDALYNSGVIFKDKLDKLALSEKQFTRLLTQYPSYSGMDDAYYHLFLLYSRLGQPQMAASYLARLQADYPDSKWTTLLSDPYFADNQRFGIHIEDSLYAATYDAFKDDRFSEIRANVKLSGERFPLGANRDKFVFIGGLSKLNAGDADGCLDDMNTVVKDFPQSKLAEMAGMIVNGVKQGRRLHGGHFDLGDVWARRQIFLNEEDSLAEREFSEAPDVEFYFMIAYEPDSVSGNQLLYQLAKFNFTNYLVRNFDIEIEYQDGINVLRVGGFNSYYEAREYAQEFERQENIRQILGQARIILISRENLDLLGTRFSYDDYDEFYAKTFEPLQAARRQLLFEPSSARDALDDGGSVPGNISPILQQAAEEGEEGYGFGDYDSGIIIDTGDYALPADDNAFTIDEEEEIPTAEGETVTIEEEEEEAATADDNAFTIGEEEEEVLPVADDNAFTIGEEEEEALPADEDNAFTIGEEAEEALPADDNAFTIGEEEEEALPAAADDNAFTIGEEEEEALPAASDDNAFTIGEEEEALPAADDNAFTIGEEEEAPASDSDTFVIDDVVLPPTENDDYLLDSDDYLLDDDGYLLDNINVPIDEDLYIFDDDEELGTEDEYFDLDGF